MITKQQKQALIAAWNWCDAEDKSTEFMFQFMVDSAQVDYDTAVEFVMSYERTEEDFE